MGLLEALERSASELAAEQDDEEPERNADAVGAGPVVLEPACSSHPRRVIPVTSHARARALP